MAMPEKIGTLIVLGLVLGSGGLSHSNAQVTPPLPPAVSHSPAPEASAGQALVRRYCSTCHNDRQKTGGLTLEHADVERIADQRDLWEKVVHKLRTNQMPPPRMPRPDRATLDAFAVTLERTLDAAAAAHPDPGHAGVRRMNGTEYANAIRDLFALEIDAHALLLPDEADEGFDNIASSLTLSPAHLERYLSAARTISRMAIGDPTIPPDFALHQIPMNLAQDRRVSDDLPFGSAGGVAIAHHFAVDGEYVIAMRLRRQIYDYIIGLGSPHHLDVRIDGKLVKRFTVGGEGPGTPGPRTFVGETVGDTPWEDYMHTADSGLTVRVPVLAGQRTLGVSFVARPAQPEGVPQPPQRWFGRATDEDYDGQPAIDSVSIAGPYAATGAGDTPSRRALLSCRPTTAADRPCAQAILSKLARRAYRRPVTDADVRSLLSFYDEGRRDGGFEAGIRLAIERLLMSADFLFRIEDDRPPRAEGPVHRVSDLELASRLSFFLWSSIPDEALLDLAARGELKTPAVLERQVRRMLADRRATALVENFAGQWLTARKARTWQPDPDLFPEFDDNLRQAFVRETNLFIEDQLRADHSVIDLVSANYSFLNERLARHYGVPGIHGDRFRKVSFDNGVRGGLLGQGSLLMVTSYPDRTTPVVRGKWLLDNILGMPPPPPPPDVPSLAKAEREDGRVLSIRERMQEHRKNPACAVCHVRMDPLGFSLENFDAVGRWRTTSDGLPIDASAAMPEGRTFDGVAGLRTLLLEHRDDFAATLTSKLLTYALGRGLQSSDAPAVRTITRQAAMTSYRWSSIVLGIVNSVPFQMRRTTS